MTPYPAGGRAMRIVLSGPKVANQGGQERDRRLL